MKRFLIIAAAAAVLISIAYFGLSGRPDRADYMEAIGVVEATEVEISAKISGRITWLCCREGDAVKAAEPLVRLDGAELDARVEEAAASVREAEAAIEGAAAFVTAALEGVKESGAEVQRVGALLSEAKKEFERVSALFKEGVISERELDKARAGYDSLNAQADSMKARESSALSQAAAARAKLGSAKASLESSKARVKLFSAQLQDTSISSPIDGTVVYKAFETGETVVAGVAIYTVHDTENIWARVDIEETNIGRITRGRGAVVTTRDLPGKEFKGDVIEIGGVGGFATQRDVTRGRPDIKTFRVKVAIRDHMGLLKEGMTVSVRF
ncbi:MAG: efflux RND transporter periplasmic adaptor subunit [Deltaproteobacteria bacterium]|nr:efflux RND transporter periplasmic adaptor subunit [Deltaproteobacteria bacterium]